MKNFGPFIDFEKKYWRVTVGRLFPDSTVCKQAYQKFRQANSTLSAVETYEVQMWVLIIRQWNYILRNAQMSYGRLIQGAIMGVIIGSCFFQLKLNLHDLLSRFGALFYIISTFTFGCMPTIPFLVAMRSVHVFQVKSHYYRPFFFFLAYQLVELFWASIEVTFFVTGLYAMGNSQFLDNRTNISFQRIGIF